MFHPPYSSFAYLLFMFIFQQFYQMDELIVILQQRRQDITRIQSTQKDKQHKSLFQDEERKRIQRENWILKVLKSLKILSIEQKKVISATVIQIMKIYSALQTTELEIDEHFTEKFINLFVEFYNSHNYLEQSNLKHIIRPNNCFVFVDLIKSLLEISRKQYKQIMRETYQEKQIKTDRKKIDFKTYFKVRTMKSQAKQSNKDQEMSQKISKQDKIEVALYEKYVKMVDSFNEESIIAKANDLYLDLQIMNHRNSEMINKYNNACFGSKRRINYNISGLYTQEEMRKMMKEQHDISLTKKMDLKELKGNPTSEQLKEYFKMKIQIHESTQNIPNMKIYKQINDWFPVSFVKKEDKYHPLTLIAVTRDEAYCHHLSEFEQKFGKTIKNYAKQLLFMTKQRFLQLKKQYQSQFSLNFNKKQYLSFNNHMVNQILSKEIFIKKDLMFPLLKNIEREEEAVSSPLKLKIKSQIKFNKKPALTFRENVENSCEKQFQKGISYSKFIRQINSKERINDLIDTIIKSRMFNNNSVVQ